MGREGVDSVSSSVGGPAIARVVRTSLTRLAHWKGVMAYLSCARVCGKVGFETATDLGAIKNPASFPWHEVKKVAHYWLEVDALTQPTQVREGQRPYGGDNKSLR